MESQIGRVTRVQRFCRCAVINNMMPQFSSPADFSSDDRDEWVECSHCRSVMLPLRDYEISSLSEFPPIECELWEWFVWGWMALAYHFLFGLATYSGRKTRVAQQKRALLPRFPRSLICPRCLAVRSRV